MFRIKTGYMIPVITLSTDILVKFAYGRKQTRHGVVRDILFSVVRNTPDELYIQTPLEYPRLLQETFFPHTEPE